MGLSDELGRIEFEPLWEVFDVSVERFVDEDDRRRMIEELEERYPALSRFVDGLIILGRASGQDMQDVSTGALMLANTLKMLADRQDLEGHFALEPEDLPPNS